MLIEFVAELDVFDIFFYFILIYNAFQRYGILRYDTKKCVNFFTNFAT